MLFNGRTLIFMFSRTQVRIAEHEHLQSLFRTSMGTTNILCMLHYVTGVKADVAIRDVLKFDSFVCTICMLVPLAIFIAYQR